jgi:hypothetical protein
VTITDCFFWKGFGIFQLLPRDHFPWYVPLNQYYSRVVITLVKDKVSLKPLHPSATPLRKPILSQKADANLSQIQNGSVEQPPSSTVTTRVSYPRAKIHVTQGGCLDRLSKTLLRDFVTSTTSSSSSTNGSCPSLITPKPVVPVQGFSELPIVGAYWIIDYKLITFCRHLFLHQIPPYWVFTHNRVLLIICWWDSHLKLVLSLV